jgi:SNF2 family DNA or RNA helicase
MCEPSPKLDVLEELTASLEGKQFVVCAESRQLIELAAARLEKRGESIVQITGRVPDNLRPGNIAMFQRGEARVLLFTVKAGGSGLNMTAADTIIRLQRSWSMLDNKQALDRVHRIGSEIHESILVIDIIAPGTVEEDQLKRLYVKQQRLDEITRDKATLINAGMDTSSLDAEEFALLGSNLLGQDELGI